MYNKKLPQRYLQFTCIVVGSILQAIIKTKTKVCTFIVLSVI